MYVNSFKLGQYLEEAVYVYYFKKKNLYDRLIFGID